MQTEVKEEKWRLRYNQYTFRLFNSVTHIFQNVSEHIFSYAKLLSHNQLKSRWY